MDNRPAMHERSISQSSSSGICATKMILEHILSYPGTYEIPLRTMYALNSAPRAQPHPRTPAGLQTTTSAAGEAAHKLTCSLMAELSQMPNQPNSLPPAFITSFLRKCFTQDLSKVDFNQALTGLDYLKDLESRRCREMKATLERLEIGPENAATVYATLQDRYPAALDWYHGLEDKVHKVEALYTQLYLALRRWILINELSLPPFNKHNCHAMLNTVYPPIIDPSKPSPTPQLTADLLKSQRDGFFKYIQGVEKKGTAILGNLIAQGKRPGEETGWPAVCEVLDRYLQTANSMIDECTQLVSINDPSLASSARASGKADSGISMVNPRKDSTSSEESQTAERPVSRLQHKSSTALEKLAREIRHIRRNKTDVSEMIQIEIPARDPAAGDKSPSPKSEEPKTMRKMKSLSSINLRRTTSRNGSTSSSPTEIPKFDQKEMKKHRSRYDFMMMAAAG